MNNKGILTVISGFSGAGKGTAVSELVKRYNYSLSISATTRKPRQGEIDGKHYFFISEDEFKTKISNNGFLEYANYVSNYYGTPKSYVDECLNNGKDVILEIEVQGALRVKELCPDALLIFMVPPSAKELYNRLVSRNTEDISTIRQRMIRSSKEAEYIEDYDYLVINDNLDECIDNLHRIISSEKKKIVHNSKLVNDIKADFISFGKEI